MTLRDYPTLRLLPQGEHLLLVTLHRPEALNALDTQMGRDLLAFPTRESRLSNHAGVLRALSEIFQADDRDGWCRRLEQHDVPHSPVYDASEALESPQARRLGLKQEAPWRDGSFVTVRNPVVYDRGPPAPLRPPPQLDQDRQGILDREN